MADEKIALLLVEDNRDDADLLLLHLEDHGLAVDCQRVDSAEGLREALARRRWDAVVCDHSMPGFSGVEALEIFRQVDGEAPFLFVSGTIGEELAVRCMKAGAQDYMMKDNISRLVPALERELEEAHVRRSHRVSQQRNRQIVEQAAQAIWMTDGDGRLTYLNPYLETALGIRAEEWVGRSVRELLPDSYPEGEPVRATLSIPGGRSLPALISTSALRGHDGARQGTLAMATDLTQVLQLESQLLQSQKLEILGQLAGGVAHDFNNLLSVILGFSEMVLEDMPESSPDRESLAQIIQAAHRGAALTRQLLILGRRHEFESRAHSLSQLLGDLRPMLTRVLGSDVELAFQLEAAPDAIRIDANAFSQVMLNLVVNARDAMPRGGPIEITTGSATGRVWVRVRDAGEGIAADHLARIFEPFFTTKESGKGTGLGLSTVFSIVQQSEGAVDVQSTPGQGTTFTLSWPLAGASPETGALAQAQEWRGRGETLMVVEENAEVLQVLADWLSRRGYQVLTARNAREALRLEAAHTGPLHLVLSEIGLPGMKGPDLCEQLRARRPGLRTVLLSGVGGAGEADAFLAKPVQPGQVLETVYRLLSGSPGPG